MYQWIKLLWLIVLLPAVVAADVAETYEVNAEPASGLGSNVAVDIIGHDRDSVSVWLATGKGVSFSFNDGQRWYYYNAANGLPSENTSAMASVNGRIWVATSHNEMVGTELYALSDGVSYSDDNGLTWHQVNFGEDGLDIPYVWGGDRVIYDITGHHSEGFFDNKTLNNDADWVFFTAFAGGYLASQDGGTTWRRIYASAADSIQFNLTTEAPSYRNRYFACVVDTSHGDSLFVWTGTAGGVFQYVYIPPSDKLYSRQINAVAFCDTCSTERGSRMFIAGDNGLSIGSAMPGPMSTTFTTNGLPGASVTAAISIGEYLLVGTTDTTAGVSTGLAVSTDEGESFTPVSLPDVVGSRRVISSFLQVSDRLYMAAQEAGLFVSADSGQSWSHLLVDSSDEDSPLNIVNAVNILEDTLLVGTDSGLVELLLDTDGTFLDARHNPFDESTTSGARIIKVKPQQFFADSAGTVLDSSIVWTVNRAVSGSGTPMVGRRGIEFASLDIDTTIDSSVVPWDTLIDTTGIGPSYSWASLQQGRLTYDVNFFGDTAFVVGDSGIYFTTRGIDPGNAFSVRQYSDETTVVATMDNDIITMLEVKSDTVIVGSTNGLAISNDRGARFTIYRPNVDTLAADYVINHTILTTAFGITGNFVPAMGVQPVAGNLSRIWASGRPVETGYYGISYGEYGTIYNVDHDSVGFDIKWRPALEDVFAWNFAFNDDFVYAATDEGLLMHDGTRDDSGHFVMDWETVALEDPISGETLIEPGTPVYGVAVVDSFLWVGTDDGTVKIGLESGSQQLYQKTDSTTAADEVYAFPVPFSSMRGGTVDFHFVVPEDGYVTLEVYDYAMNLVSRPIDNVFYTSGIYPDGSHQGATWDGYNGNGDRAAVGIYYFKVELPSGENRWGKLAIIP